MAQSSWWPVRPGWLAPTRSGQSAARTLTAEKSARAPGKTISKSRDRLTAGMDRDHTARTLDLCGPRLKGLIGTAIGCKKIGAPGSRWQGRTPFRPFHPGSEAGNQPFHLVKCADSCPPFRMLDAFGASRDPSAGAPSGLRARSISGRGDLPGPNRLSMSSPASFKAFREALGPGDSTGRGLFRAFSAIFATSGKGFALQTLDWGSPPTWGRRVVGRSSLNRLNKRIETTERDL